MKLIKNKLYILFLFISFGIIFDHFYQKKDDYEKEIFASKDILLKEFNRKKNRRLNGYHKTDKPDRFLEVMNSLKIKEGEKSSGYEEGYKIRELMKANRQFKSNGRTTSNNISSNKWVERGPNNVPGRTRSLIVDQRDASHQTWFAGSVSGGIWKTTNKGISWVALTENIPNLSISDIVQSKSNPAIFYASTGEGYGNIDGVKGDGIVKSTDGGNTWSPLLSTINNYEFQVVNRVIVDPNNENKLVVCTSSHPYGKSFSSSIFISNDGGKTWEKTYQAPGEGFFYAIHQVIAQPDDFSIQYGAINNYGIVKSIDGGQTWELITNSSVSVNGRVELAISSINTNHIYASIAGEGISSSDGNLYISRDAGDNWSLLSASNDEMYLSGQGWYDNTIMAHPFDTLSFYVGGVDLWKVNIFEGTNRIDFQRVSNAYGEDLNSSITITGDTVMNGLHPDHHLLVPVTVNEEEFYLINTNDGGVYYSNTSDTPGENDGDWTFASYGYNTTQFYGIDKKKGSNQYIGGSQDNGTWISNDNPSKNSSYRMFLGGDGFDAVWHSQNDQKLLATIYNNYIFASNNGGYSYYQSTNGLTDTDDKAPFITKLANSKKSPETVYTVGASGVWKSDNFGSTWKLSQINQVRWRVNSFMDIKISEADERIIWAGSSFQNIVVSKNRSNTFNSTNYNNEFSTLGNISGIATDPFSESTAYLLFSFAQSPKILKTTDFGQTWSDLSGFNDQTTSNNGFPDVAVYDLFVFPFNDQYIWAGTEIGIYETLDGGLSWHPLQGEIPAVCIWDINYSEDQVYVGTHGRGIWSLDIPAYPQPKIEEVASSFSGADVYFNIASNADSLLLLNADNDTLEIYNQSFESGSNTVFIPNDMIDANARFQLISYKNNLSYKSNLFNVDTFEYNEAVNEYVTDFQDYTVANDFSGNAVIFNNSVFGFTFPSLHSDHPYQNNTTKYTYLKSPIVVQEENSHFMYKDVALISIDGDYVSIEAKKGNEDWVSISGEYDSSIDETWEYYAERGSNGVESLEVPHEIDLQQFFSTGDTLLIRFKLHANEDVNNWGWAITYLNIQSNQDDGITANIDEQTKASIKLYPNVIIDGNTNLVIDAKNNGVINYQLIDLIGKEILSSSDISILPGLNKTPINLQGIGRGVYVLSVYHNNRKSSFKLVIE